MPKTVTTVPIKQVRLHHFFLAQAFQWLPSPLKAKVLNDHIVSALSGLSPHHLLSFTLCTCGSTVPTGIPVLSQDLLQVS